MAAKDCIQPIMNVLCPLKDIHIYLTLLLVLSVVPVLIKTHSHIKILISFSIKHQIFMIVIVGSEIMIQEKRNFTTTPEKFNYTTYLY